MNLIYYSTVAPSPSSTFVRPLWYVTTGNDLWIWSPDVSQYVLYIPDVTAASPPSATTVVSGIVLLATTLEAAAGVNTTKAVTPAGLASALATVIGSPLPPTALSTISQIATALGSDPAFATTVTAALATKANASGSNVSTPALDATTTALMNAVGLQAVLADTGTTTGNATTARSQTTVTGATNAAGTQRMVTLPALSEYVDLKERTVTGASTLTSADDVVLLDGASSTPILTLGNPALLKRKPYRLVCVNFTNPPQLSAVGFPFLSGATSFVYTSLGQSLTVVPTSLGKWAIT